MNWANWQGFGVSCCSVPVLGGGFGWSLLLPTPEASFVADDDSPGFQLTTDAGLAERYLSLPGGILFTKNYSAANTRASMPNLHGDVSVQLTLNGSGQATSIDTGWLNGPYGQPLNPTTCTVDLTPLGGISAIGVVIPRPMWPLSPTNWEVSCPSRRGTVLSTGTSWIGVIPLKADRSHAIESTAPKEVCVSMSEGDVVSTLAARGDDWMVNGQSLLTQLDIEYIRDHFVPVFQQPRRTWIAGSAESASASPYGYQPLYVSRVGDDNIGSVGCRMAVVGNRVFWVDISAQDSLAPHGAAEPSYGDGFVFERDAVLAELGSRVDVSLGADGAEGAPAAASATIGRRWWRARAEYRVVRHGGELRVRRWSNDWWWVSLNEGQWESPIADYWIDEFVRLFRKGRLSLSLGVFGFPIVSSPANAAIRIAGVEPLRRDLPMTLPTRPR